MTLIAPTGYATALLAIAVAAATGRPCGAQVVFHADFDRALDEWRGYGASRVSLDTASWTTGALRLDAQSTAFVNVWLPPEATGLLHVTGRLRTTAASDAAIRVRGSCIDLEEQPLTSSRDSWSMRTMSVLLPPGTGRVEVQAATEGEGTSWFDDIVVQIVAQDSLPPASELAAEYVSDAIDTIRAHSLRSKEVDWGRVRALAARRVRGANRPCETWPAITEVFEVIGESHGWHSTPSEVAWYATNQVGDGAAPLVAAHTFPGRVGFLSVPRVPTTDSASVNRVASAIQDMVREHGQLGVCRWVVDLRDNSGGNMWPMLTGLGWLLGDGVAGAFVGSDRARFWGYENDASYLDGELQVRGGPPPTGLFRDAPVAVLYGPRTGSSGEAIAVAFRGRPRSRSFGQPTAGLTTATSSYGLSDGSNLTFATSVFADRAGTHYGGPLSPDIEIESGRLGAVGDPVLDGALDWLRSISCTS